MKTGDVAQLGEHRLCKAGVRGSSPLISTKNFSGLYIENAINLQQQEPLMRLKVAQHYM